MRCRFCNQITESGTCDRCRRRYHSVGVTLESCILPAEDLDEPTEPTAEEYALSVIEQRIDYAERQMRTLVSVLRAKRHACAQDTIDRLRGALADIYLHCGELVLANSFATEPEERT